MDICGTSGLSYGLRSRRRESGAHVMGAVESSEGAVAAGGGQGRGHLHSQLSVLSEGGFCGPFCGMERGDTRKCRLLPVMKSLNRVR